MMERKLILAVVGLNLLILGCNEANRQGVGEALGLESTPKESAEDKQADYSGRALTPGQIQQAQQIPMGTTRENVRGQLPKPESAAGYSDTYATGNRHTKLTVIYDRNGRVLGYTPEVRR